MSVGDVSKAPHGKYRFEFADWITDGLFLWIDQSGFRLIHGAKPWMTKMHLQMKGPNKKPVEWGAKVKRPFFFTF